MLNTKDATIIYDTLLASPGMNDEVKIGLRMPRKTALVLAKIIELGLAGQESMEADGIFKVVKGETMQEIQNISGEIKSKAGLTEMFEKLKALSLPAK